MHEDRWKQGLGSKLSLEESMSAENKIISGYKLQSQHARNYSTCIFYFREVWTLFIVCDMVSKDPVSVSSGRIMMAHVFIWPPNQGFRSSGAKRASIHCIQVSWEFLLQSVDMNVPVRVRPLF